MTRRSTQSNEAALPDCNDVDADIYHPSIWEALKQQERRY